MEKKKIEKSIESLEKQKEKHKEKIDTYEGVNYSLIDYWGKEIRRFEEEIEHLKDKLKKK